MFSKFGLWLVVSVYFLNSDCILLTYGSSFCPISGKSIIRVSDQPMIAITIDAPTSAQNPLATPAIKLGQSIFQGE